MDSVKVGSGLMADKNQDTHIKTGNTAAQLGKDDPDSKIQQQNEFNLDRSEYQQVFKVFDKNNTGEITIHQVYDLINKFDNASAQVQGGSNLYMYQSNQTGAGGQGQIGQNNQHRSGRHNQLGTKSYAQGTTSSQLYQNGQHVLGTKKQGSTVSNAGGPGYKVVNGQPTDNSKMSSPNRIIGNNNQQSNMHGASIQNGGINGTQGSINPPRLSKSKQISPTLPGGINNYQQNNKEKSPRRQSQYNNNVGDGDNYEDNSPGIGQKNSKIKGSGAPYGQGTGQQNINNSQQITSSSTPTVMEFPNGKESLQFEEFIDVIRESCSDNIMAENYLVLAFSMFDRQKKGYISKEDLKQVFEILGESITDEEVNTMVKIAGIKSSDKINFKEFVDFFYKID